MRKLLVVPGFAAAGALALVFASGGAQAASNCSAPPACNTVSVTFASASKKASDTLTSATLGLALDYLPPGTTPQTLVPDIGYHTDLTLPVVFGGTKFFSCSQSDVNTYEAAVAQGQKPPKACNNAQVGSGSAQAYAVVCHSHPARNSAQSVPVTLGIQVFNSGNGLVAFLKATSPPAFSAIQGSFPIAITSAAGGGSSLSWELPDALLEAIPGTCSPITSVTFNLNQTPKALKKKGKKASTAKKKKKGKKGKKAVYLKNAASCPSNGQFQAVHHVLFTDGSQNPDHTLTRTKIDEAQGTGTAPCTS